MAVAKNEGKRKYGRFHKKQTGYFTNKTIANETTKYYNDYKRNNSACCAKIKPGLYAHIQVEEF